MTLIKSASLILLNTAKSLNSSSVTDYKILLFKRLIESTSFSNNVVFPGGILDKCDYDKKWMNIIDKYFNQKQLLSLSSFNRKRLYDGSFDLSTVMPEIFYRICAIRETFEETGVLLAVDQSGNRVTSNNINKTIIADGWNIRVSKDPSLFIELFNSFNIVPDLTSLVEWSLWITPKRNSKRFRTVFFLNILEDVIDLHLSIGEGQSIYLTTPDETLQLHHKDITRLAPPQLVEMKFLSSMSSWPQISLQGTLRQNQGVPIMIPVIASLSDCKVMLLPGDCRYPSNVTPDGDYEMRHLSHADISRDTVVRRSISKPDGSIIISSTVDDSL